MRGASRNLLTLFYAPRRFFQARAEDRGGVLQASAFAFGLLTCAWTLDWFYARLGWSFDHTLATETLGVALLSQVGALAIFLPLEAGVMHFALYGLGSARVGFAATYCVCAYSVAFSALSVVPWVGSSIATVAWIPLLVVGLRETHGISTGRAVLVSALGWLRLLVLLLLGGGLYMVVHRH